MRKWGGMRATLGVFVAAGGGMSEQMIWGEQQVAAAESPAQQPSPFGALDFTSRKEPIHIRSHDLEFFYNQKRIIYRGSVVATQGDSTLKKKVVIAAAIAVVVAAIVVANVRRARGSAIEVEIAKVERKDTGDDGAFGGASYLLDNF